MNVTKFSRALAVVAVAGVVLAGCAGGTEQSSSTGAGNGAPSAAAQAERNDADVEFLRGMIPHHRQAVEMAELVPSRSQNAQVVDLATRIGAAQAPEIKTMTTWLQGWGEDVPEPESAGGMGGMDHGGTASGGMMTPEQMGALGQATGVAFDRMFLENMTAHHRGAVEMATVELREGENPGATQLAQTIIDTQQVEITEMEALLKKT